jgi:hypothetical protein
LIIRLQRLKIVYLRDGECESMFKTLSTVTRLFDNQKKTRKNSVLERYEEFKSNEGNIPFRRSSSNSFPLTEKASLIK